jgi:two-component system sensor histidine kinase KdpD
MTDDGRPNPESLLRVVQKMDSGQRRGRLRVFLGMCPGVGKTYAMLKAAHEQQTRGINILIGVVETHGRKETEELIEGLTILPRTTLDYRGSSLQEMDLDLILRRKPELVLVDELAHTNAPGTRHLRRFQDVEEILTSGIDVYTTLNIQHIESRNDQVAQITGISVRETVPDAFLEQADQIEVIDLSPSELLYRLREGKVYLQERAEQATKNFFKEENLTALRELALRFTAEKVDQDLSDQMTLRGIAGPWNINERLLVAISYSPYSGRLLRATRRMAYNLEAPWIALYVDTGQSLRPNDQRQLQKNLTLARELGAEVITTVDHDLTDAIQKVCRDKNVTQIVMGRPDRRFLRDLVAGGTLLDELVRGTSKIDIHVIRAERAPRYRGFYLRWPQFKTGFFHYYHTAWFLAVVSILCYFALPFVGYRALGSVFLLSILTVAGFTTHVGAIVFAAAVATLVWDYCFIPPRFTFAISAGDDLMMVLSFFVTALVGGLLTSRIRKQQEMMSSREERSRGLYELSRSLSESNTEALILSVLVATIERQFSGEIHVLMKNKAGGLESHSVSPIGEKEFAVASWTFDQQKPAGWSTSTLAASRCLCLPLKGNSDVVGVLALYPGSKQKHLNPEQESFLAAVINQVSLAIERLRYLEEAQAAKLYETSEQLHQTLLNSISHEMRTPLTVIMAAATALEDAHTTKSPEYIKVLGSELLQASDRLNRVIENLLDMSRLNSGVLALKLEWVDLNDLLRGTVDKLGKNLVQHSVSLKLNEPRTLIYVDFRLFEHALSNLLLNAASYSPAGTAIEIRAQFDETQGHLSLSICDQGPGIPAQAQERVFEKFYRVPGTPTGGTGLGLSIVKSIVEAHHGNVHVESAADGGSCFVVQIPVPPLPQGGAM